MFGRSLFSASGSVQRLRRVLEQVADRAGERRDQDDERDGDQPQKNGVLSQVLTGLVLPESEKEVLHEFLLAIRPLSGERVTEMRLHCASG